MKTLGTILGILLGVALILVGSVVTALAVLALCYPEAGETLLEFINPVLDMVSMAEELGRTVSVTDYPVWLLRGLAWLLGNPGLGAAAGGAGILGGVLFIRHS